jgi:hypothetical protein
MDSQVPSFNCGYEQLATAQSMVSAVTNYLDWSSSYLIILASGVRFPGS